MHDLRADADNVDVWSDSDWTRRLNKHATTDRYTPAEIDDLPEPVQRYFTSAIAEGTILAKTVRLRMRGFIKVGMWLPFRARQLSNPHVGFRWTARAVGLISGLRPLRPRCGCDAVERRRQIPCRNADGPDISPSAAGRCGCEGVMAPTALLPRFGVTWTAEDDQHITARLQLDATPATIGLTINAEGQVDAIAVRRWGDPRQTGTWSWHTFGGEFSAHRTFAGLTIPSRGRLGWDYGTSRWPAGEFFRYGITELSIPTTQADAT